MNSTTKHSFNTFLETDPVDFEAINENWTKLDDMNLCVEGGIKTGAYDYGMSTVAKWYYKRYSDGTVEMSAKLDFSASRMQCNTGAAAPYISGDTSVYFPFDFKEVYDVQMHLASNTRGYIVDTTGSTVKEYVKFRLESPEKENTVAYKQVFISVKGVVS